jgi:two-component system, LytTR family, response regulator
MLNCIIVDDEAMGRRLIEDHVAQFPFLKLFRSCRNAFEAMEALQESSIDLLFLDIQMPGMLGTVFLKSLKKKPLCILVTAYSDFALEGYELDVVDYLMKPVSTERFAKAVQKAYELHQQATHSFSLEVNANDSIFLNIEYALVKVRLSDILFVEGLKDYVKIYLESAPKPLLTKLTLKGMEERLPAGAFMRSHRSYIVNLSKVDRIKGPKVYIQKFEIPLGEGIYDKLVGLLNSPNPTK